MMRQVTSSLLLLVLLPLHAGATTWYVDASVPQSGDGTTWESAFKKVQEGIIAASNGDTVIVAEGTYVENIQFNGKNIILTSTDPLDPSVIANTVIDGNGSGSVVTFEGTEDETCVLSGFTTRNGVAEYGGGIRGGSPDSASRATIQNNTIVGNSAGASAGGLLSCNGTIQNNTIAGNSAEMSGGGLYRCNGTIRNCIIWVNTAPSGPQLHQCSIPTYSCIEGWTGDYKKRNISGDPQFAHPDTDDFRLLPSSPCIDRGFSDPELPETDIAGMHRIMFGGKSFTVDMGAYEYYINELSTGPEANQATLTWSSLADRTYSIFYSADLLTWHLAVATFPSSGNTTTSWIDDGSLTGLPPSLVPRRFYRVLENP